MTEERDPLLQSLFEESPPEVVDEEFTKSVMAKTYTRRNALVTVSASAFLLLALYSVFIGVPLQDFTIVLAQILSTNLVDFGEGWLALIVSPLNSVAGLSAIGFKGVLMLQKKLRLVSI